MNLLALDTSTEYLSLALTVGEDIWSYEALAGQRHAELTLPQIELLAAQARIQLKQLDGIALAIGPGSFTGLRIGCGIVQGLAFGLGKPVVGVNSLEALAAGIPQGRILAVTDARMGELYLAAYEWQGHALHEIVPTQVVKPDALPELPGDGWQGCGGGFLVQGEALTHRYGAQLTTVDADRFPHARGVLRIAHHRFASGDTLKAENLELLYIRNKVALTAVEQAALRKS